MSDTNERSAASAGSVAGEPVAWAVMVGGRRMYVSWCKEMCEDEAYYHRHPDGDTVLVVPLYRNPSPTLTDEERKFLQNLHGAYEEMANQTGYVNAAAQKEAREHAVLLKGLLEKHK